MRPRHLHGVIPLADLALPVIGTRLEPTRINTSERSAPSEHHILHLQV
jgi:hypothetical protein